MIDRGDHPDQYPVNHECHCFTWTNREN